MLICPVFPQTFRIINNLEKRFNFNVMNSCRQNKQAGEAARVSEEWNTFCCLLSSCDPGLNLEQFLRATPECKSWELLEPGELTLIYRCALIPAAFIPSVFIPAAGTAPEHRNCSVMGAQLLQGLQEQGRHPLGTFPRERPLSRRSSHLLLGFIPRVSGGSFSFAEVFSSSPTEQCRWLCFSRSSDPWNLGLSYAWHSQLMIQNSPYRNGRIS